MIKFEERFRAQVFQRLSVAGSRDDLLERTEWTDTYGRAEMDGRKALENIQKAPGELSFSIEKRVFLAGS